jgi:hypothetical protein
MRHPKIGDCVSAKETVQAYYSGGIEPMFEPGDIGIVAHVDVPCVRGREGSTFNCVDFTKDGREWRVALKNNQLVYL